MVWVRRAEDGGSSAHSAIRAVLLRAILRGDIRARHLAMVKRQQSRFVIVDRLGVLPDITGVVNSTRQSAVVPLLDRFQRADTNLRAFCNLFERHTAIASNRRQSQDALFLVHQFWPVEISKVTI